MKKKFLLLGFSLIITLSATEFTTKAKASEPFLDEKMILETETETFLTNQGLDKILGDTNEVFLSEDTIDFITDSDFEKARLELDEFTSQSKNLTINEINKKAAEILTELSDANRQKAISIRSLLPDAYNNLNSEEKKLVALYPGHAIVVYDCSTKALNESSSIFQASSLTDGNGDAFRHAYWNVLMTVSFSFQQTYIDVEVGARIAKMFADAHESESTGKPHEMDIYNNMVGRNIANEQFDGTWFPSESSLSDTVLSEVQNGRMRRISKNDGKIYATDSRLDW